MTNSSYIPGFDILKFVMALVIVSLHAEITTTMNLPGATYVANFQAMAVPVFFILSAYLFFEKLKKAPAGSRVLWQFERRLLVLYLVWSVIMLPITLRYHDYQLHGALGFLLWTKDFFFDYTFLASWFFGALIVGTPIVYLFRKKLYVLVIISLILYCCFVFYDDIPFVLKAPLEIYHQYLGFPQRSFLCGIIWISVGCILSSKNVLPFFCAHFEPNSNPLIKIMGGVFC